MSGFSSGSGFPGVNVNVGHMHYNIEQGIMYLYQGGTPSDSTNWFPVFGRNIAMINAVNLNGNIPADTNPTLVTFQTQTAINISLVNGTDFVITQKGTYSIVNRVMATKTGGAAGVYIDQWIRVNGLDVVNSGTRQTITTNNDLKVLVLSWVMQLNVGDVVRKYIAVSQAGIGLGSYTFSDSVGPIVPAGQVTITKID